MSEFVWMNGRTLPFAEVRIGVEDRGYQFGDGVYEVIRVYGGKAFTLTEHLDRLARSAEGIRLHHAFEPVALATAITEFIGRHGPSDGMVYLQVTRGVAPRNHVWPAKITPTILFYTRPLPAVPAPGTGEGVKVHTVADERWKKCWIKSIALLANVLAKNEAADAGADEAVFIEDGVVSECSASNLFAVIGGKVVTHPIGAKVLPGITRLILSQVAPHAGVEVVERPLGEAEARAADELFITSTTRELNWVSHWDNKVVGAGRCGPITKRLHEAYVERVVRDVGPATATGRRALATA